MVVHHSLVRCFRGVEPAQVARPLRPLHLDERAILDWSHDPVGRLVLHVIGMCRVAEVLPPIVGGAAVVLVFPPSSHVEQFGLAR